MSSVNLSFLINRDLRVTYPSAREKNKVYQAEGLVIGYGQNFRDDAYIILVRKNSNAVLNIVISNGVKIEFQTIEQAEITTTPERPVEAPQEPEIEVFSHESTA